MSNQQKNDKELEIIKENVCKLIKDNDIDRFNQYINTNEKDINRLSYENDTTNFDILIYSIQNNVSIEIIKAILPFYKNKSLNYIQNRWSPLIAAFLNNKFEIANLLLENNADIKNGYEKYSNILQYILSKNDLKKRLNDENIKYILDKLYEKNIIPIDYNIFFDIIDDDYDYYKMIILYSIEKEKMKLIEKDILYDLHKNILQMMTSYDYGIAIDIQYTEIIEMSTLLLIKNCNNREEEEDKIFDIFWELHLKKVYYFYCSEINFDHLSFVVDKYIKDITLKNKIHRYIDNKLISKEK